MTAPALLRKPAPADDTAALLHRILAELAELRAAVAPDLAQRVVVLGAFLSEFSDSVFTATDALEAAAAKPEGDLAGALVPLLGGPVGGLRRLSRRLAKLCGKPAAGLMLVKVGDDRGSALYAVQNTPMGRLGRHG